MLSVTLTVGMIIAGATPGSTTMKNSTTHYYPDIRSCVAALQQELESDSKPGVISVSGTCTVLRRR
jgi:hypothetical protein